MERNWTSPVRRGLVEHGLASRAEIGLLGPHASNDPLDVRDFRTAQAEGIWRAGSTLLGGTLGEDSRRVNHEDHAGKGATDETGKLFLGIDLIRGHRNLPGFEL